MQKFPSWTLLASSSIKLHKNTSTAPDLIGGSFLTRYMVIAELLESIFYYFWTILSRIISLNPTSSNTNSMQIKHHNKACTSKASHIIIFTAIFFWSTACTSNASHIIMSNNTNFIFEWLKISHPFQKKKKKRQLTKSLKINIQSPIY